MSYMKQQMQETTGFFKKQKQAFADKVHKGLGKTFMSGSKKDNQDQITDTSATHRGVVPAPPSQGLEPEWVSSLAQMGFREAQVQEASAILGGQPEQMDDLLQVLAAMSASSAPQPVFKTQPETKHHQETTTTPSEANVAPMTVQAPPPPIQTTTKPQEDPAPEPVSVMLPLPARSCGSAELEEASAKYRMSQKDHPQRSCGPALSPSALTSLQHMGFASDTIQQATATLGSGASYEELFDMLLSMGSPLSPPIDIGASSSSDIDRCCAAARLPEEEADLGKFAATAACELIAESLQQAVEMEITEDVVAPVPIAESAHKSLELRDISNHKLAAAIVASVIAKAGAREKSAQYDESESKQNGSVATRSPVKGGA
jgi:Holliday junction resolvasome RuvABC DNA-binding subunit